MFYLLIIVYEDTSEMKTRGLCCVDIDETSEQTSISNITWIRRINLSKLI